MRAAATKSPRGRTPMMSSVLRLITRPLICRGTRVWSSVIIVAPTPTWKTPDEEQRRERRRERPARRETGQRRPPRAPPTRAGCALCATGFGPDARPRPPTHCPDARRREEDAERGRRQVQHARPHHRQQQRRRRTEEEQRAVDDEEPRERRVGANRGQRVGDGARGGRARGRARRPAGGWRARAPRTAR